MKFLTLVFSLVLILNTFFSCDQKKAIAEVVPSLGDTLDLYRSQSVRLVKEDLQLVFTEMQESRCPEGTNCVRAGEVKITIDLTKGASTTSVKLEAKGNCMDDSGKCGNARPTMGYEVKLLNVYPYPGNSTANIKRMPYARVIVKKK